MIGAGEGNVSQDAVGEGIREDMFSRLVGSLYRGPGAGNFALMDKGISQSPFGKPQV